MIYPEDVTIFIPHWGCTIEEEYSLNKCYSSLQETVPGIEILIATNGNNSCEHSKASDIHISKQGQCMAVNAAVAITNTPWIFVTNDDMIYSPLWFEKFTLNVEYDDLKCVSPKLIEPRPGAPTFETYFCGGAGGDFDEQKWLEFFKNYQGGEIRTGFNLPFLISRDLWDIIGGYDINYDPWGSNSDSDLLYKIRLAGVQPMQNPRSIVYHFSQTSGTFEPRNQSYWGKNWDYFKTKWGFERTDKRIWEADFPMPTKEEGRIFNPYWENFFNK